MAKIAIMGDIHANLDALNVVLADCREQGVEEFLCTGDVVGYNACPHECIEIIRDIGCPVMMGNHDYYVGCEKLNLNDFNPNAAAVVLAHNHPAGIALPSKEDVEITVRLREALEVMDVVLLDHIVVADDDFVSMRDSGYLRRY